MCDIRRIRQLGKEEKAVLIDDRMSIVGSYNMDMRSTYQDTELMLAVDCPELNSIIQAEMERDKTLTKQTIVCYKNLRSGMVITRSMA